MVDSQSKLVGLVWG